MSSWIKLAGDTWYYPASCNVGYNKGVAIDSAIRPDAVTACAEALRASEMPIRWIINTHGHSDHFGANRVFKDMGAKCAATRAQLPFIEDRRLGTVAVNGSVIPTRDRQRGPAFFAEDCEVDLILPNSGEIELSGTRLLLEPRPGHCMNQVTILTEDDVLFIGDVLMSEKALRHIKIPMTVNVIQTIDDMEAIRDSSHKLYVPAHGQVFEDPRPLVEINLNRVYEMIECVFDFIAEPRSREQIIHHLFDSFELRMMQGSYSSISVTVGGIMYYLSENNRADSLIHNNRFYYKQV